ncbi:Gfo/Idh/MocA family protein [Paenibacillus sp. OV219]|uniref:Gfo/Idh/MocA family protein n=1 Tax=Paenibacillus sp. OV219 TaxID=1884377 RepID=UPI0008C23807|nr:Gfo/Idh/MocA family oxidoreductase [Paenibacillus sp. OV219]SEN95130.1 Predicted dehydrogenase [Paenibacillus sp. OV219]
MSAPLRAVVIGAGWAGEGHTIGLRSAGVEVAAICARNVIVVKEVADRLQVPVASIDWRATLRELKPDIISLATPAVLREDVIQEALALGAHIVCEKPLAVSATEAQRMLNAVEDIGIKHAYAATQAYDPTTSWIQELVQSEAIGRIKAVEISAFVPMFHSNSPWTWTFDLSLGGGALHNVLTHFLGILSKVFGSDPIRVMGESRLGREKAPVIGEIHDWRQSFAILSDEEVAAAEWKSVDADSSFNAILEYRTPSGDSFTCTIQFDAMMPFSPTAPYFRIYGERGTIDAKGIFSYDVSIVNHEGTITKTMPDRLLEGYADTGNGEQNKWNAFFREFVRDVKGEAYQPYPTFREGYRDQRIIEVIRSGSGWTSILTGNDS